MTVQTTLLIARAWVNLGVAVQVFAMFVQVLDSAKLA